MSLLRTDWKIVTTEEVSASLILSLSSGCLYAENEFSGEEMAINYRCFGLGVGKGAPVGANWSSKYDPCGGFDNVGVVAGRYFGHVTFPCRGYIIGVGASSGVLGSILGMDVSGGGVTAVLFGRTPFAGVRLWGFGRGVLPGTGFTCGLTWFWLE